MIHIERKETPKVFNSKQVISLKKIVNDFFKIHFSERVQDKFKFPPVPESIKEEVENQFNRKCAYCESKLGSFSPSYIDNFRPKRGARGFEKNEFYDDHYWWLTYEWSNLYLSCPECNINKASWFPIKGELVVENTFGNDLLKEKPFLIDPCIDQPKEHFKYNKNGEIEAVTERGKVSIEILKLNRASLVQARYEELNQFQNLYENFVKEAQLKFKGNLKKIEEHTVVSKNTLGVLTLFFDNSQQSFIGLKRYFLNKWISQDKKVRDYIISSFKLYSEVIDMVKDKFGKDVDWNVIFKVIGSAINESSIKKSSDIDFSKLDTIEKIQIKNYRTIKELNISIPPAINDKASWLLFLGENGLGKSSILQAIAITLAGKNYSSQLSTKNILHNEKLKTGFVKIYLSGKKNPIRMDFTKTEITFNNQKFGTYLLGYGATRLLPQAGISSEDNIGDIRISNLFSPTVALHNANKWLHELKEDRFNYMVRGLKGLLLHQKVKHIEKGDKEEIIIHHEGGENTLNEMSEGYKAVIALAVDIMQILERDGTTMEDAKGVVLIDELGSHLHPRWKMRIVGCLREVFPLVQFIVTSHEPLCLRGLEDDEVVVLKRYNNSKEVSCLVDLPSPKGFRVDQLLTSEFFGLYSTVDPEVELLMDKYYELLYQGDKTNQIDLERIKKQIRKTNHLGNSLREEMLYVAIDTILAHKQKKKEKFSRINIEKEVKNAAINLIDEFLNDLDK